MSENASSLRECDWEAHDESEYLRALFRDQANDSIPTLGERFAMAVNCKTKSALVKMMKGDAKEAGGDLIDFLVAAEKSLKFRLTLIECAFARMTVVAEVIGGQREAGPPA